MERKGMKGKPERGGQTRIDPLPGGRASEQNDGRPPPGIFWFLAPLNYISKIKEGQTINTSAKRHTSVVPSFPFLSFSPSLFFPFVLLHRGGHCSAMSSPVVPRAFFFPLSFGLPSFFFPLVGGWLWSDQAPSFLLSSLPPSVFGGLLAAVLLCSATLFP